MEDVRWQGGQNVSLEKPICNAGKGRSTIGRVRSMPHTFQHNPLLPPDRLLFIRNTRQTLQKMKRDIRRRKIQLGPEHI